MGLLPNIKLGNNFKLEIKEPDMVNILRNYLKSQNISNPLLYLITKQINHSLSSNTSEKGWFHLEDLLFAGLSAHRNLVDFVEEAIRHASKKGEDVPNLPKWYMEARNSESLKKEFDFEIKAWGTCQEMGILNDIEWLKNPKQNTFFKPSTNLGPGMIKKKIPCATSSFYLFVLLLFSHYLDGLFPLSNGKMIATACAIRIDGIRATKYEYDFKHTCKHLMLFNLIREFFLSTNPPEISHQVFLFGIRVLIQCSEKKSGGTKGSIPRLV